jgi:nitrogen fixation/metabolism regulation signal transduction histidine kinase
MATPVPEGPPIDAASATGDGHLLEAALATSRSIYAAQVKAERELREARDELRRQNAELARANALLAAATDAMPAALIAVDQQGTVTLRNRRFDALFGVGAAEAPPPNTLDDALRCLAVAVHSPPTFCTWLLDAPSGSVSDCRTQGGRHLECHVAAQVLDGVRIGSVYAWHDVTDRVEVAELRARAESARLADAAKSAFMSRASHELRTPLNAVIGFSDLLQTDPDLPRLPHAATYVGHIARASRHVVALLDDLMQITRMDIDSLPMATESLDLAVLAAETVQLTGRDAAARNVDVQLRGEPEAWVLANRTRVLQVLLNLTSNAIKYNRPGGSVRLLLERGRAQHTLAVEDTGRGLSPEQVAHLFEPFNRLGAEQGSVAGTGLGLVITRRLVERMGGTLAVRSTLGRGSVFSVSLPAAPR